MLTAIVRRIHLWAGVILGVQVLLWMASGVVMSWFHIDLVRGERNAPTTLPVELDITAYASPGGVIAQSGGAYSVELRRLDGNPIYEVRGVDGVAIYRARDGAPIDIDDKLVRRLAAAAFVGDGEISDIDLVNNPPPEYRGATPVWRVQFDDGLNTRLYLSNATGDVVARRNDIWRLYDFFWMLHIMDYGDRTDFNNPLIKTASAAGLVFAFSGLVMIFFKSSRQLLAGDVNRLTGRRRRAGAGGE